MRATAWPAAIFLAAVVTAAAFGHSLDEAARLHAVERSAARVNRMIEDIPASWRTVRLASPDPTAIQWAVPLFASPRTLFVNSTRGPANRIAPVLETCTGEYPQGSYDYRWCALNLRHGGSLRLDRETGDVEHCAGTLKGYEDIESKDWCPPLTVSKTGG